MNIKAVKIGLLPLLVSVALILPARSEASPMREFIMSCTYGVLAGTLVGGAMLAFTDQPGDNLSKVARGASLGLYAGILLGVYVVYIVPGQLEDEAQEIEGLPPPEEEASNFQIYPLINPEKNKIEGVATNWTLLRF